MKVISLEINEFRGIRYLFITLNGKNASVYGPNGSGKSGVVDALDFLLTGKITRLTGEGTSGISLKEHGKHIDADINDSYVRGCLRFDDIPQDVEVKRFVNKPNELIYEEKYRGSVEPILKLAARGHYVLTRKNLLKYIVAKSGERGKEIQGLLNIDEIEKTRTVLVKNQNIQEKNLEAANITLNQTKVAISNLCGLKSFSIDLALEKINKLRANLNGNTIDMISSKALLAGIALPESSSGEASINTTTLLTDHEKLCGFVSANIQNELQNTFESYLFDAKIFLDDPKYRRLLNLQNFIENGIKLIDDSGTCPLCEIKWEPEKLLAFLNTKLIESQKSCRQYNEVKAKGDHINRKLIDVTTTIKSLHDKICFLSDDKTLLDNLRMWQERINHTIDVVANPFEQQNLIDLNKVLDLNWILPEYVPNLLEETKSLLESKKNEKTPEQIAWDTLNQLTVLVSNWENAKLHSTQQKLILERSEEIKLAFIESRDAVLKRLFDSITDRFVSLYRAMHGDDEKEFSADISFTDTGIDFVVDFYGRGKKPPQALHSEGHQDSMGICLYLALAEELTEGVFNLIVLDDVVMSVDADHRRQFSKLLGEEFPNIQFVITTHDRVWATQLRSDGVVSRENSFEFNEWSIDHGPIVYNEDSENWEQIYELVRSNKVPQASATLRRSSEQFLATVCENLEGQVVYRSNNQRELGELSSAVICKYKKLLKTSKSAYHSWGNDDELQKVMLLEQEFDLLCNEKEIEEWAINPTTHFNPWATFSSNDFLPVVDVFKRFFDFFKCPVCGSIIKLIKQNNKEVSLCCKCKNINLNLEKRPKEA